MKTLILILTLISCNASADSFKDVQDLAVANGFKPSQRVVKAIVSAAKAYHLNAIELASIGIIESGLGKYVRNNVNSNGTVDAGIFQINTVNRPVCIEFNLTSPEGSALCAAKLLANIKTKHADYMGRYHSKTPSKKRIYLNKIAKVIAIANR
jgi:hypothetical protein